MQMSSTFAKGKDSTMVQSGDPTNSLSPQILHTETQSSTKRVDTLNEIM